ncbi:hypothetical protein JVT61DRAFT_9109 [Boletus reticuloceps]|uniref:Methyltransferase domain-containing protein n=1 Tax=Boletus reticuloceps TaxID=495285 RepID=A0A8I2YHC4_9AGAM|nr:hypothetical protein JVT61DRAFT_9109 [Boletus reticuloceps]
MTMVTTPSVVGVDKWLPREPTHRRPIGEIILPLMYTNDLVNFDHWDHMFMTNCSKGLTLYNFDGPPATILDLGCGCGLWAIEVGRQWQVCFISHYPRPSTDSGHQGSTVVGFDVQSVQPKLSILDKNLARRLKWVHGNLYCTHLHILAVSAHAIFIRLDGLLFLDGQFDFVRMVHMGLHILEDEVSAKTNTLKRISSNSLLKIIKEDLIFPSQPPFSSVSTGRLSENSSPRSSNTTVSPYTRSDPSIAGNSSKSANLDSLLGSSSSLSLAARRTDKHPSPPDPRDHSRLRRAWEEMLGDSFLMPNLVLVLPFHLGAWFRNIQTHPPLEVPLPPSSLCKRSAQLTTGLPDLIDPDTLFELRSLSSTVSLESDDESTCSPRKSSHRGVSLWASMHLARTVQTITACKESIWHAYERLYGQDPLIPSLVRSAQVKYLKKHFNEAQSTTNPLRDYFERDWINWENDMVDRTSVRGSIQSKLSWNEPRGKPPGWRAWFNSLPPSDETEYEERPELCRRLRGFVCFEGDMAATNGGRRCDYTY